MTLTFALLDSAYTLPIWLQVSSSIATVISASAVIVYIFQLIFTKRQIGLQLKISNDQLKLSKDQFRLINQGYLEISPIVSFLIEGYLGTNGPQKINDNALIRGLRLILKMNNVGNIPFQYSVKYFNSELNQEKHDFDISDDYIIVYPKQEGNVVKQMLFNNGPIRFNKLMESKLLINFEIDYNDINDKKQKMVSRRYSVNIGTAESVINLIEQKDIY